MKIAVDIRHLATAPYTGVGRYTIEVLTRLLKLAPEIDFIAYGSGSKQTLARLPELEAPNLTIVKHHIPNRLLTAALLTRTRTLEDNLPGKIDRWWFPDLNIWHTRLPYLATAHDLSYEIHPQFFKAKTRLWHRLSRPHTFFTQAHSVVAVSSNTKSDLVREFGVIDTKITVTPLGFSASLTSKEQPNDRNFLRQYGIKGPYFLSMCTLEPRKNIESIIEGYDAWRQEHPTSPIELVIAGTDGWRKERIHGTASAAWFRDDIKFLGYVPEKHQAALYRHATALLFPSFYEGFGLPVLEAMACGTPVIASNRSSLPEVVGDAGILIDPYNVTDLTVALSIITDSDTRIHLSSRSLERAQNFDWDKTAELTLKALKM